MQTQHVRGRGWKLLFEFYIYLPAGVRRESVCLREAVSQEARAEETFGTAVLK